MLPFAAEKKKRWLKNIRNHQVGLVSSSEETCWWNGRCQKKVNYEYLPSTTNQLLSQQIHQTLTSVWHLLQAVVPPFHLLDPRHQGKLSHVSIEVYPENVAFKMKVCFCCHQKTKKVRWSSKTSDITFVSLTHCWYIVWCSQNKTTWCWQFPVSVSSNVSGCCSWISFNILVVLIKDWKLWIRKLLKPLHSDPKTIIHSLVVDHAKMQPGRVCVRNIPTWRDNKSHVFV